MIRKLMEDPTRTLAMATEMVAMWERNGMRHRNGQPVTEESIRRMNRPSSITIKKERNAGRTKITPMIREAKRRHWHGIS